MSNFALLTTTYFSTLSDLPPRLLLSCSPLLPGSVSNEEAWQHGRLLVVGTQQYIIELNPPIVEKVCPLVGQNQLSKQYGRNAYLTKTIT